jgi:hypothetical protein
MIKRWKKRIIDWRRLICEPATGGRLKNSFNSTINYSRKQKKIAIMSVARFRSL